MVCGKSFKDIGTTLYLLPESTHSFPPITFRQATQLADASITATTSVFEPGSTKAVQDWYEGELGKKIFNFGPLVPFSTAPYKAPPSEAQGPFQPVYAFLDSHSPKSVMLVSFGSVFFPYKAWQLEAVFKTLLETRTPFITSRAPAMYQPSDPKLEKTIQESGLGLFVDYVPQRDILGHPNIGSFLTHGGNNSMWESIGAGVLNVFWPFEADQPMHAAYMTEVVSQCFGRKCGSARLTHIVPSVARLLMGAPPGTHTCIRLLLIPETEDCLLALLLGSYWRRSTVSR